MKEKSRKAVDEYLKKNKKKKEINWVWFAVIGIIVIFAIIATAVIVTGQPRVTAPGEGDNPNAVTDAQPFTESPKNMPNNSFTVGAESEPLTLTDETVPNTENETSFDFTPREDDLTTVQIFLDPQCPVCKVFEETNGELLTEYANSGDIAITYSPISFLDDASTTQYSSRATNALACVADQSPSSFESFLKSLFVYQPEEGGEGLSNGQIFELANRAGAEGDDLETCFYSKQYGDWVTSTTNGVLESGRVQGTPAVFIDGNFVDVQANDGAGFKAALDAAVEG